MVEFRQLFLNKQDAMLHPQPMTLPNFSKASVLVVGDVAGSLLVCETRVSPKHLADCQNRKHRPPPWRCWDVAQYCALGAQVALLGITGNDEAAHLVRSTYRRKRST